MKLRTLESRGVAALIMISVAAACGDDSTQPELPIDVEVQFTAQVNGDTFTCGQSFAGVGTSSATITPTDYRFYVSDVTLISADGSEHPLELDQEDPWQLDNLALLDFENGQGPCVNGTAATNSSVRGMVPAGTYTGIEFTLGVPEALNHADQTTAPAPLDLTALFWSWNGGYKFARIDHVSEAQPEGWNVHLGSTGCQPSGDPTVPATSCANPHRVTVRFDDFDWASDEIVADLGALLANSDVTLTSGPKGCMSFPGDADCAPVMNAFGLAYEGSTSSGQVFFRTQ